MADRAYLGTISLPLIGLFACLCVAAKEARCDIYAFTDDNGTPSFSNVPTDARYVLAIRTEQDPGRATSGDTGTSPAKMGSAIKASNQKMFSGEIRRAATAFNLEPALLHAVIAAESGYNTRAVSGKGAMGLMQLMPETARQYGAYDPFDPGQNIWAGASHLSDLLQHFGNNLPLALAAYNSGEANVVKYGVNIPPFRETMAYVPRVIGFYKRYRRYSGLQ
jgi:Transglycosylase SLT domain